MAGEYIIADSIDQYWKQLKAFYEASSPSFQEITADQYNSYERSEREDSDNRQNQDRLGTDSSVVDITFYKYLPQGKIAYRTHIISAEGQEAIKYYQIQTKNISAL